MGKEILSDCHISACGNSLITNQHKISFDGQFQTPEAAEPC